ncbi:MAG: glycosyltransferase family 4 protein [Candidatus Woesearchaeota archaeon]|nr:glycosyltransferase family 4 protein [Candidatus Woesearchaeota archaeon]
MARVTIDWEKNENVEWQDYKPKKSTKEKRRLLITTDNFLPRWDGISRFLAEIIPRLKEEYDITIIAPNNGPIEIEGVEVIQVPLSNYTHGDYTAAKFAYKEIKHFVRHTDIIFNQSLAPIGACAVIAAKRLNRPIVNFIHNVDWELVPKALSQPIFRGPLIALTKLIVKFLYNRCTLLILPSENIAEHFTWQGVRTPKRIAHLGVDVKKFSPRKQDRKALGIPENAFVMGYHGRISHEKNLFTLLRAFKRVEIKNKRLLIVGDGVEKIKERLGSVPGVIVTGATDNVVPYLRVMDLYVQPSLTETTSLAVLEAMACGLPVVSSKVGFIKYYIIENENGLFFENTSAYDLMVKLQRLYDRPEKRAALGKAARATILESFRWSSTAQAIKDALDSV